MNRRLTLSMDALAAMRLHLFNRITTQPLMRMAARPILTSLLLLIGLALCPAQAGTLVDEEIAWYPESLRLTGSTSVPIRNPSQRPTVDVLINGKGPFRMLFDTGAAGLMIDEAIVDQLRLPVVGKGVVQSPLGDGFDVPQVRIQTLELGDAVLSGVLADQWNMNSLFPQSDGPRGVMGPSLFRDVLLTADFAEGKLHLEYGSLQPGTPDIVAFTFDHGLPLFELYVGQDRIPVHLDSGNSAALIFPLEENIPTKAPPKIVGRARLVDAEVDVYAATLDGDVRFGTWVLHDPVIQLLPGAPAANIGIGLLKDLVLTLDQHAQLARLRRANL